MFSWIQQSGKQGRMVSTYLEVWLVHVAGSERHVLSHPSSPPSQTILEICIRRGGISIQGPAVRQWNSRGMDAPPAHGSENLGNLWQGSSKPLRLQRQLSLPNLFYKEHGCPGPRMVQPSAQCFSPSRSAIAGTQASQGTTALADFNIPPLEEPTVGVGSYFSCWKQPCGRSPWDRTSSLKRTARYGLHGPSYGPCMCGRSTGAYRSPKACHKHYGRS